MTTYDELQRRYGDPARFVKGFKLRLAFARITQLKFARECGFDYTQLNRWLSGRVMPSWESMLRLDDALDRMMNYEDH